MADEGNEPAGEQTPTEPTTATPTTPATTSTPTEPAAPAEGQVNLSEAIASGATPPAAEGQPSGETPNASEGAGDPPAYEPFTLPEGYSAQEADLKVFSDLATELGADQEHAQKLIDLGTTLVQTSLENDAQMRANDLEALQNEWRESLHSDSELGGANLEATQRNMDAFQRTGFASNELLSYLKDTGQLMHPEVVRLFSKIGASVQENPITFGSGDAPGGKTPAQRMFANSDLQ